MYKNVILKSWNNTFETTGQFKGSGWTLFRNSDGVLPYINLCIVWGQWSTVETGATRVSARFDHRQWCLSVPGCHTRLNHPMGGQIPSRSQPQLLHDGWFLDWERGAPPCGWEWCVHQLTHFFPGSGGFISLDQTFDTRVVVRAARQLFNTADTCGSFVK